MNAGILAFHFFLYFFPGYRIYFTGHELRKPFRSTFPPSLINIFILPRLKSRNQTVSNHSLLFSS